MNDKRDFDRAVDRWLDDGFDATPPTVIDAVLLAVRSTPQEGVFRVRWRSAHMNRIVGLSLAAAAVVAAVIIGSKLLGSPTTVGGPGGEPSPSASVARMPLLPEECAELEAGTYRAEIGSFSVMVSLPTEWKARVEGDSFYLNSRASCLMGGGVSLTVSPVGQVYSNACDGQRRAVKTNTPAAVTAALAAQTGHQTSGPRDTTIAGYPASRFVFSIPRGETTCNLGPLWLTFGGDEGPRMYEFDGSGSVVTVYVVDVGGSALGIAVDSGVPDEAADVPQLKAIVASLRIQP